MVCFLVLQRETGESVGLIWIYAAVGDLGSIEFRIFLLYHQRFSSRGHEVKASNTLRYQIKSANYCSNIFPL
jgi:hypothetical protein